ncbi:MAG: hypothetical protein IJN75_04315 [Clostridia bacterium]|nr:hypothetical protein [Clostridia bacterium]
MKHKTPFNKTGVKFFTDRVIADTMNRLDYGQELNDISVKVGNRFIAVPMCPESYENLCTFLKQTLEDIEQC